MAESSTSYYSDDGDSDEDCSDRSWESESEEEDESATARPEDNLREEPWRTRWFATYIPKNEVGPEWNHNLPQHHQRMKDGRVKRSSPMGYSYPDIKRLKQLISSRIPRGVKRYNILLCGLVGVGKSSLINTLMAALNGEIKQWAHTQEDEVSVTRKLHRYLLGKNISLMDIPGMEERHGGFGPSFQEMRMLINGEIDEDSFEFGSFYDPKEPKYSRKVHTILFVVDAEKLGVKAGMPSLFFDTVKYAKSKQIPWTIVLTKIDKICPDVHEDAANTFHSRTILKAVEETAEWTSTNQLNVLPIKNYTRETETERKINMMALFVISRLSTLASKTEFMINSKKEADTKGAPKKDSAINKKGSQKGKPTQTNQNKNVNQAPKKVWDNRFGQK